MQKRVFGIILVLALVVSLSFASAFWPFSYFKNGITGKAVYSSGVQIIDNNQTGFALSGNGGWVYFTGEGYQGGNGYYIGPGASASASWTFSGLEAGVYQIFVSYLAKTNRPTDAAYSIYSGANLIGSSTVNQRVIPSDFVTGSVGWKILGNYTVNSSSLKVSVSGNTNGYLIVDSVRILKVASLLLPSTPTPAPTPSPAQVCSVDRGTVLGDMNGDGVLNNQDTNAFTLALVNPGSYSSSYPCLNATLRGDINRDGVLNNQDSTAFTSLLVGAAAPTNTTTTNTTVTCTDSDNGLNYFVKGLVDYRSSSGYATSVEDKCLNNSVLVEYSCLNFSSSYFSPYSEYNCANGCYDGACKYALGELIGLKEGEVVRVAGTDEDFKVSIAFVDYGSVRLNIDGEVSASISVGRSILWGGLIVKVSDILYDSSENGVSKVVFSITEYNNVQYNSVCNDLISKVVNPISFELYGRNYEVSWNSSYNSEWWIDGASKTYKAYQASWSTSENEDGYKLFYTSYNVMLFDDASVNLEPLFRDLTNNMICVVDNYWNSNNQENRVYVCNWDILRDQPLQGNWEGANRQILWYNDNVLVQATVYSGASLTDEEINKVLMGRANDLITSIKNNEYKYADWSHFNIPYPVSNLFYNSLMECSSDVSQPVRVGTNETCSPSWQCKLEPSICPEYGWQTRTCIDYNCEQPKREDKLYCSPGICSGCYTPRWLGGRDSVCIPYGTRFEKQIGWNDKERVDSNNERLSVATALGGVGADGNPELNLTISSNGVANLYVSQWGDKVYRFSKGDTVIVDTSQFSDEGVLEMSLFIDDVVYNSSSYTDSYIEITAKLKSLDKVVSSFNAYCDYDGEIRQQKTKSSDGSWASCQNNYECFSNLCSGGECVEINDAIRSVKGYRGLFIRALCGVTNMFNSEGYEQCLAEFMN